MRLDIANIEGCWELLDMQRSNGRIITTHAGSLPRPDHIVAMVRSKDQLTAERKRVSDQQLSDAIREVVKKQIDTGLDVVNDGEFSKSSFVSYVCDRLSGLAPAGGERVNPWGSSRDARAFPDHYQRIASQGSRLQRIACVEPIAYTGQEQLDRDLKNLKAGLAGREDVEAFLPSVSVSQIQYWISNQFYSSEDEYLTAIADAIRVEYKAIVDAGFLLQIDDPRLVTYYMMSPDASMQDCRKWAAKQVEVLNYALRDISPDRVRYHTCYSIDTGPRVHDMPAANIVDLILQLNVGAISFEGANPRHEHEWQIWCDACKSTDTILIPGVVTHSTVLVEHPELVAERLMKYTNAIGAERIVAGTDCGFATVAGADGIASSIAWAKLEALVQGAEIASKKVFGSTRKPARSVA
jgi:5-methyltetrahydropteroyltriglutamate--homocysteine methyltransferase